MQKRRQKRLLHDVSKRFRILNDAIVSRHDRDELRRFPEQLRSGKMNGVECTDWFYGERPACACKHSVSDGDDIATPSECLQPSKRRPLLGGR
jgi:hypothetical protein